jgi:hypothetical protein
MLFKFPCFIINEKIGKLYIDYSDCALSCHVKHAGNKLWNASNKQDFHRSHEAWILKSVHCL